MFAIFIYSNIGFLDRPMKMLVSGNSGCDKCGWLFLESTFADK